MGRYDDFYKTMGMILPMFQWVGDLNERKRQADLTYKTGQDELGERQRQFDINVNWTKDLDTRQQGLLGKATNRTEQELLVDTEVAKNPYKFGKGWRRNDKGEIEPYAYEMTTEQQKLFANQNNGSGSGVSNPVVQSFQDPATGDITTVFQNGEVKVTKGNKTVDNKALGDLSNFLWILNTASKGGFNYNPKTGINQYVVPTESTAVRQTIAGQWDPNIAPYGLLYNLSSGLQRQQQELLQERSNAVKANLQKPTNWWEE